MSKRKAVPRSAAANGYRNKAFVGAFNKGVKDRRRGMPLKSCPYSVILRSDGRVTFSCGYARAWRAGWHSVAA